jgi:hypothetical protein
MGRCGSSAIQDAIAQNANRLVHSGFGYPVVAVPGWRRGLYHGGNATNLALYVRQHAGQAAWAISRLGLVVRDVREPNCLFSSEFLHDWSINNFALLRRSLNDAGFAVRVLVYVREQREWLMSRYAQAVKRRRWTVRLQDYILSVNRDRLNHARRIKPLVKIFGRENLSVRVFDGHSLIENDVRKDFLSTLGVDYANWSFRDTEINRSANLLEVELLRAMNALAGNAHFNNARFLDFSATFHKEQGWPSSRDLYRLVDPEIMRSLGSYFAEQNEEFRRQILPEIEPPIFKSVIPDRYVRYVEGYRSSDRVTLLDAYKAHRERKQLERRQLRRARKKSRMGVSDAALLRNYHSSAKDRESGQARVRQPLVNADERRFGVLNLKM